MENKSQDRQESLKAFMRQGLTGVYLIHAYTPKGQYGMTANSMVPCSLSPPLFSFNVKSHSRMYSYLKEAKKVIIQQLNEKHQKLSEHFARGSKQDLYKDIPCHSFEGFTCPKQPSPSALCAVKQSFEVGDHHLFIVELEAVQLQDYGPPLIYHQGGYRQLA